jgi:NAD(P)-dependent dehydrogenase (short-subunit alcohol dehydrogenase family)
MSSATATSAPMATAEIDVTDEVNIVRMIDTALESFGGLDVLHNDATDSASNATDVDIVTLDMAVFDRLVAVNLKGVVMVQERHPAHARPRRRFDRQHRVDRRQWGAWDPCRLRATKAGIVQFTKSVAAQYGLVASVATPSQPVSCSRPQSKA